MNITNDLITGYINGLYRSPSPALGKLRAFGEENHVPIILKDTEGMLVNLLRMKKTRNLLEIGTAIGYSACCFAECCDCRVTTIEADEQAFRTASANIAELGFSDRVTPLCGDARQVLQELQQTDRRFDAVFIDAAKSHYREFWELALPLCEKEAVILCDNVLMKGMTASDQYDEKKKFKTSIRKMREFLQYITEIDYADTCILPVGDGVSFSLLKDTPPAKKQGV